MNRRATNWLVALALSATAASGIAQEKIFKGSQVSESTLIEALEIDGPSAPAGASTRGFGRPLAANPVKAPGAGKASLLITFATNSADLTQDAKTALDTVARALQSDRLAAFSFRVEGHADPRGAADHNQWLSQSRAEAVVSYLVAQHGLLPERLAAIGKGSAEVLDPLHPEAPENRRVTIVTRHE